MHPVQTNIPPNDALGDTRLSLSAIAQEREVIRALTWCVLRILSKAAADPVRPAVRQTVRSSGKSAFSLQLLQLQSSELIDEMRCTKRSSPARKSGSDNWRRQNIKSPVLVFLYLRRSQQL